MGYILKIEQKIGNRLVIIDMPYFQTFAELKAEADKLRPLGYILSYQVYKG